ncbi:AMP-dependent synthetase/ligase [Egbenema bharatensis]|uniref:AMP-dependent synthetase/ligase n=1 Tax=Egbenema bharatensis TaxID=3463334 RepID=UPI003A88B363
MIAISNIYRAPPDSGSLVLGRSLLSLLDEACECHPNEQALNQWQNRNWQSLSNHAFRTAVEECALGLLSLGLERGDRVAFVMHSDLPFCIADMGCLLAGLVNVPIDLTQTIENILFILQHTAAKALIISNLELLNQLLPHLGEAVMLQWVLVVDGIEERTGALQDCEVTEKIEEEQPENSQVCLQLDETHVMHSAKQGAFLQEAVLHGVRMLSLQEVRQQGKARWSAERLQQLRSAIDPKALATMIYIASETKQPKGVMLSHENISADILSAFSSYPNLATGAEEVVLLFLPLTHIFARAFFYGHLAYGHSIYFSDPGHVIRHLKSVNPTFMITVPRVLEKIYERILEQGRRLSKFDRAMFFWALKLAQRYEVGQPLSRLYALRLKLADRLVFARWRSVFGDRLKAFISGGAALRAELTNVFSAAGLPVLQGYGLTETSAVLCYNRGEYNRAGTVGVPIPGVELTIAEDSEILVKAPFVMQGYYRDPLATQRAFNPEGWLHTGDLGELSPDGFLKITGVKKPLFKLTTGKYVSPLPLEQELMRSPYVSHSITVGANQKFCGMLIFPNLSALRPELSQLDPGSLNPIPLDPESIESWLQHPCVLSLYQSLIDAANCHLPYWSTVRKFRLMNAELTIENGLLKPDGTLNRVQVIDTFAIEIAMLYGEVEQEKSEELAKDAAPSCVYIPPAECPVYAKSLTHY